MISGNLNIRIEQAENGYVVEVPNIEELNKREKKKGKDDSPVWYGDCTDKKVAKTAGEVLEIVKAALANLPEVEYAMAFDEAARAETK